MNQNTAAEFNQDLLMLYACHKTQLVVKNRALRELYILLEFFILTIILYEFLNAEKIQSQIPKEDWEFLRKWRTRLLKKHAIPGSKTIDSIAKEMEIDFDHYFIESIVSINLETGELLGINFGTHDLQILNDNEWRIVNELTETVIQGMESHYERAAIANIEYFCKTYAAVIERHFNVQHFHYASGVMFNHPEPCEEDKYMIMYYYTFMKLAYIADILIPPLDTGIDVVGETHRISVMKIRAEMIESFGECVKAPTTPLAEDIAIRINDHVDTNVFALNRSLRNNLHYGWHYDFTVEELARIDKFQKRYFEMVLMSFDERLNIKVGRTYRVVMWIAEHTDTERIKAKRKIKKEKNNLHFRRKEQ